MIPLAETKKKTTKKKTQAEVDAMELELKKLREELNKRDEETLVKKYRVTMNGLGYDFDELKEAEAFHKEHLEVSSEPKEVYGAIVNGEFLSQFFDIRH